MNPKSPEARNRDDKPFDGMTIDSSDILETVLVRSPCPKCFKSRMYFCYTCYVPVSELEGKLPLCKLPIKVDIIKHKREIDGKSTAAHAALLAPYDVKIYEYPDIPDFKLDGKTVLLYPGIEAKTVSELFEEIKDTISYADRLLPNLPVGHNLGTLMKINLSQKSSANYKIFHSKCLPIEKVVLIDSTWNQSRGIYIDERIKRLPTIVLQNRASQFWRHQKGSPRWYLSTIEALHQLVLELHLSAWGRNETYTSLICSDCPAHENSIHPQCLPYNGQYDNLLYFFKYMYEKLHKLYKHEDLLAYKRPMTYI